MENPALLLGVPLVVVGAVGVLVTLATLLGSVRLPDWLLEPAGGMEVPAHPAPQAAAPGERAHPGPAQYVGVAGVMGVVEVLELVVYYLDLLGDSALAWLLILTVVQFGAIAMWYMHLRFDSRTFSTLFVGGLILAAAIFIVVLATLGSSLV